MHLVFAHAGLHRVRRGSEIAFERVAQEIAIAGAHQVSVIGSGKVIADRAYTFKHIPALKRERFEHWPTMPFLRNEYMYEELTFALGLAISSFFDAADVTIACGYPYTNWALRRPRGRKRRPRHVFVTQNGDWAASKARGEPRFFSCDGLICTNPVYFERNRHRWRSVLIPNGVDSGRFHPGMADRRRFGFPEDRPVVLMVSALQSSKRVLEAIRAVSHVNDAFLVVAGDGILRDKVDSLARELLPNRFLRAVFPHEQMPDLYRSADLFLHTTIGESFGNVYVEALSTGTPIVAHDDEITRWILGDYALLIDTRSESTLTEAVKKTIQSQRPDLKNAVAWAQQQYNWPTIAQRYTDFLKDVAWQ